MKNRIRIVYEEDDNPDHSLYVQNLKIPVTQAKTFWEKSQSVNFFVTHPSLNSYMLQFGTKSFSQEKFNGKKDRQTTLTSLDVKEFEMEKEVRAVLKCVRRWNPPPKTWFSDEDCNACISSPCDDGYSNFAPPTVFVRSVSHGMRTTNIGHAEKQGDAALNYSMQFFHQCNDSGTRVKHHSDLL